MKDYILILSIWFLFLVALACAREPSKYPYDPDEVCYSSYNC